MKQSLKKLKNFSLKAIDGEKGKVKNFLFDEKDWTIRYFEADIGNFFSDKRVLIPIHHLGLTDTEDKHFIVNLRVEDIKNSPDLDYDLPVSRQYEASLLQYYQVEPYWPEAVAGYAGRESLLHPGYGFRTPQSAGRVEETTSLRSFSEVSGYYIKAIDDQFGHLEDLIVDDKTWHILYAVIDTKNLSPWSKEVILPVEAISEISFFDKEVTIPMHKDEIKNAPEYDPDRIIEREYDTGVYQFYSSRIRR
jgi:hypothetical protein